jgi:tetratricopeptide (TPR) repeat protein
MRSALQLRYLGRVRSALEGIASRYIQRRVLLVSLALLGLLFAVTAALARMYHAQQEALVAEWFRRGSADLTNGKPRPALEDFRNALSYDPDNAVVQLHLAEALLADGRPAEARSYLVNLWERTPGSGQVNLDLAHASEQLGEMAQAVRYYRGSILGSWEDQSASRRRSVRLTLCDFLLSRGRVNEAEAEIAGLAADTPATDGILREEVGRLYLRAKEPGRALSEFEAALETNPRESQWLADAGRAAYEAGDYLKAETYFSKADRENPSPEIHALLVLVRDVLGSDPFLAGLSDGEQTQRTWRDFDQALARFQGCAGANAPASSSSQAAPGWQSLSKEVLEQRKRVNLRSLRADPELRNEAMQFVFRIESATAQGCGPPTGKDQALLLIAMRREGAEGPNP